MNSSDKPTPVASLPDNWSTFNGHEVLPRHISRAEAAATLRRPRGKVSLKLNLVYSGYGALANLGICAKKYRRRLQAFQIDSSPHTP